MSSSSDIENEYWLWSIVGTVICMFVPIITFGIVYGIATCVAKCKVGNSGKTSALDDKSPSWAATRWGLL